MNDKQREKIINGLKTAPSQRHGAYLGFCNHTDCQRPINHGEIVTIHAYYSTCSNAYHITHLFCRDHTPDTVTIDTKCKDTVIATGIYNHPTDLPYNPKPLVTSFRIIDAPKDLCQEYDQQTTGVA